MYHVHNPIWNERIRINLSHDVINKAVLVFIFSNCSNKKSNLIIIIVLNETLVKIENFGIGFLPLTSEAEAGAVLKDGVHTIEIYKYVKDMEKNISKCISEGNHDSLQIVQSPYLQSIKSQFSVIVKLVSSQVTQNGENYD